jgi:hypothetical protein
MPSPSLFMDLNQLQQAVSRTGNDLQSLRPINQRVSQQVRDLSQNTERNAEVIAKGQSEARQRGLMEAEAYVNSKRISARLEAIAAQPSHDSMSAFLARGFAVSPPEPGTFEGPAAVTLQAAIVGELQAIKWAVTLPGLPLSGLSDLTEVTIQTENYPLQSLIFAEVNRRIEEGGGSESQRTSLNLMKRTLEREEPAAVQEGKALIAEAERLGVRITQVLFSIRTGEQDVGEKVDMISQERQRQKGEK